MNLLEKHCVPCEIGTPPLKEDEVASRLALIPGWHVKEKILAREYQLKDFRESIDLVKKVAEIAEREGHHPDIYIFYNLVRLELWTHTIKGLSENDFILAAKINEIQK